MAAQKSRRRSRKRRKRATASRAAPSPRRERQAELQGQGQPDRSHQRARPTVGTLGTCGERPPGPFGSLPVSELAMLAGGVAFVVGLIRSGGPALIVGVIVCALGVLELTAREHFSGYRSHAILLAAIPAVGIEAGLVAAVGEPRVRALLLLVVVPVFAVGFWLLRKRFQIARQARIIRLPAP
ncbi:MAG: hypothetical protein ACR2LV_09325 [Solirubrobacteraceae bacterium]